MVSVKGIRIHAKDRKASSVYLTLFWTFSQLEMQMFMSAIFEYLEWFITYTKKNYGNYNFKGNLYSCSLSCLSFHICELFN